MVEWDDVLYGIHILADMPNCHLGLHPHILFSYPLQLIVLGHSNLTWLDGRSVGLWTGRDCNTLEPFISPKWFGLTHQRNIYISQITIVICMVFSNTNLCGIGCRASAAHLVRFRFDISD